MGLSRRQFLTSTTLLGATAAAGCSTTIAGDARPNPADKSRVDQTSAAPPAPSQVTVAIRAFEPYTVGSGDDIKGPIPDVAKKVLTEMGVDTVKIMIVRDDAAILAALNAGQLDVAGGLLISKDYCHNFRFSEPDFVSATAFAVPAGNPKGLKTYKDAAAKNARVGVLVGSGVEMRDAQRAGVTTIVQLPAPNVVLEALRNGQVDCFPFDEISLRAMLKTEGQGIEMADPFTPDGGTPYIGAYAFPQDTQLLEPFNDKLKELHESGEWLRMVTPFEFTEDNEPPADLTADKICAG